MVTAIESINILMPFINVTQFLVVNMIVNLQAFYAILCQKILNNRSNNFLINLMNTKRHRTNRTIFCHPFTRIQIIVHARTLFQTKRLITLNMVFVVKGFFLNTLNFFGFQIRRIMIVW